MPFFFYLYKKIMGICCLRRKSDKLIFHRYYVRDTIRLSEAVDTLARILVSEVTFLKRLKAGTVPNLVGHFKLL